MTIAQRIELRRLGYTKEEINEMVEQEKNPDPVPETAVTEFPETVVTEFPETAVTESDTPDINAQLLTAITNLTNALQTQKLNNTPQPEIKPETPEDIFNSILKG